MTSSECPAQVPLHDLIDYAVGELSGSQQDEFEEHLFSCGACTRTLESVWAIGAAIAVSVADGTTTSAVSAELVETIARRGARVRQYHLLPGRSVACTVAPDDDFVAVHLQGMPQGMTELAMDVHVLDHSAGASGTQHREGVPVDVTTRAAVLLLPARLVRTYARSRWTMTGRGHGAAGPVELGPFTLEHSPWDERPL
jgi:anti-sigma factor RsiW